MYGNEAALKRFRLTPEEYEKEFLKRFSNSLNKSFTEAQIYKINDAMRFLLKNSKFESKTVSENGDKATVKITVGVFEEFNENKIMSKLPENIDEMTQEEKFDVIADAVAAALRDLKIIENAEFNVECKYDSEFGIWLPKDIKGFSNELLTKILNLK